MNTVSRDSDVMTWRSRATEGTDLSQACAILDWALLPILMTFMGRMPGMLGRLEPKWLASYAGMAVGWK